MERMRRNILEKLIKIENHKMLQLLRLQLYISIGSDLENFEQMVNTLTPGINRKKCEH